VIQTLSAAHMKGKMSNLPITYVIGQITSCSTIEVRQKMSILTQNNYSFEQTTSPSTIDTLQVIRTNHLHFTMDTRQKNGILIQYNCLFGQTTTRSTFDTRRKIIRTDWWIWYWKIYLFFFKI